MIERKSAHEKPTTDGLKALVNFESQVRELPIHKSPTVRLSDTGKSLTNMHGGLALHGYLDRSLVHEIGGRIWPNAVRQLGEEHFRHAGAACLVDKEGRARFYAGYESAAEFLRRLLRRCASALAADFAIAGKRAVDVATDADLPF